MSDPTANTPLQGDELADKTKGLHQHVNDLLNEDAKAPVYTFKSGKSADEKKDKILQDISLPSINTAEAKAVESDIGHNKDELTAALTNINTETKPSTAVPEKQSIPEKVSKASTTPGAFVNEPFDVNQLPIWYTESLTKLSNSNKEKTTQENSTEDIKEDSNRSPKEIISQLVHEKYFGEWYINCSPVFTSIFFTWLLVKIRLGFISCAIVGSFFATYYRTSIKRTRRNARDDMQREVHLNSLGVDFESVNWMNHFLERFWIIFEPALSAQIVGSVDASLSENTPGFLDSIRLTSFTLGNTAPRINGIKVYPKETPDILCMDWKLSFVPNDMMDLTGREAEAKVRPKIVLTIRVGKGMIAAGMPILLEDIAFTGELRIKIKFYNEMPHVKSVELSFLEKPYIDYVLKPVGGETLGFDINNIPGLESFIKDQIHATLSPMMYAPNVYTIDVAAMMSDTVDLNVANGVLAVTIYKASNVKASDMFGTPDIYCALHLNASKNPELARTGIVEGSKHPKWNETHFILINSLNDVLCFILKDRNINRDDSEIGLANLEMKDIEENNYAIEGLNLVTQSGGKPVGEIQADVHYFPVSKPVKQEDGTTIPAEESNTGIARLSIVECKEIGKEVKSILGGSGDVNAYAIVKINDQEKLRTTVFKRSSNPRWYKNIELFMTDKSSAKIEIIIMNAVDFGEDDVLGRFKSTLTDIENQLENEKNDWWNLAGGSGMIHLNFVWKPVPLTGFAAGLTRGTYSHPIGVVRIKLIKANGLKNVELLTGGKSDPYVRVMSGLQLRGRTEAVLDELNPVWDTPVFIPIHSLREDLSLEIMDFNINQNDKLLGLCELKIKELVSETKSENGQSIYDGLPAISRKVDLMNRERKIGNRGTLEYEAAFYPTLALAKKAEEKKSDEPSSSKNKDSNGENERSNPLGIIVANNPLESDLHGEKIFYIEDNKIDLLSYPAGILSVKIHSVSLSSKKKAVAELLIDAVDAQFRTSPAKGTQLNFDESGDAFVREIDLSRLTVRLCEPSDDDKSGNVIGYWAGNVIDIVKTIQSAPPPTEENKDSIHEYKLFGGASGTISLSFRYTPVIKFTLDPNDSLENQGNLAVTAISASGLRSADKNGSSDPYCIFLLNGEKIYKTQTYKKQLAPVFKKESFVVPIAQRKKAIFEVKVHDWDQFGSDELIAQGTIPIAELESYSSKDIEVALEGGSIKLRLKWEPEVLTRKRSSTTIIGSTVGLVSGGTNLAVNTGTRVVGGAIDGGSKIVGESTKVVGSAIGGGTKLVGSAIGGGSKLVGGAIGGIGRGFSKLGNRKSTEAE